MVDHLDRRGAPGVPKTLEHRAAIRETVQGQWDERRRASREADALLVDLGVELRHHGDPANVTDIIDRLRDTMRRVR